MTPATAAACVHARANFPPSPAPCPPRLPVPSGHQASAASVRHASCVPPQARGPQVCGVHLWHGPVPCQRPHRCHQEPGAQWLQRGTLCVAARHPMCCSSPSHCPCARCCITCLGFDPGARQLELGGPKLLDLKPKHSLKTAEAEPLLAKMHASRFVWLQCAVHRCYPQVNMHKAVHFSWLRAHSCADPVWQEVCLGRVWRSHFPGLEGVCGISHPV